MPGRCRPPVAAHERLRAIWAFRLHLGTIAFVVLPPGGAPSQWRRGDRVSPVRAAACRRIGIAGALRMGAAARAAAFVRNRQRDGWRRAAALVLATSGFLASTGHAESGVERSRAACALSAPRGSSTPSLTGHVRGRKRVFWAQADECFAPQEEQTSSDGQHDRFVGQRAANGGLLAVSRPQGGNALDGRAGCCFLGAAGGSL
jgi:hypothetical protein